MENLKRRFSFRKKKDSVPECSKPHQWQEDEKKVREGSCSFQVRYLGCIEVFESRGMNICEEAVKALKLNAKGKSQRAILYVSGDALRVVDEISKSMIVDQTIEKVSFCAPDRNHEKGFAYICRDGTTRRWMCHGFMAVKESGERLSHAVGCAFAICLERKQKRDKETGVTVTYSQDKTSFTRTGSFRQTTLTERLVDPQSALVADPVPVKSVYNPYAVQRPHASSSLLERQGSFRGFGKLQEESSPFKRSLSLRLNDLPSTLQRQDAILESPSQETVGSDAVAGKTEEDGSISHMCQQLTQGLSAMAGEDDPFSNHSDAQRQERVQVHTHNVSTVSTDKIPPTSIFQDTKISETQPTGTVSSNHFVHNGQIIQPARDTNPWTSASQTTNPFVSSATAPTSSTVPSKPEQSAVREVSRVQHYPNVRSHSIDSGELPSRWNPPKLGVEHHQRSVQQNGTVSSRQSSTGSSFTAQPTSSVTLSQGPGVDPFDVAWAAKAVNGKETNPFSPSSKNVKQFEVKL